jgi:hypothetical protein
MPTKEHEPAFPGAGRSDGLSKLEYFTAAALTGLLAGMSRQSIFVSPNSSTENYIIPDVLAKEAVEIARATIAHLNNELKQNS